MSNSTQQKSEPKTNRVQIDNLIEQEQELKEKEAENVKGGGGLSGGVVGGGGGLSGGVLRSNQIGEEIPQ